MQPDDCPADRKTQADAAAGALGRPTVKLREDPLDIPVGETVAVIHDRDDEFVPVAVARTA